MKPVDQTILHDPANGQYGVRRQEWPHIWRIDQLRGYDRGTCAHLLPGWEGLPGAAAIAREIAVRGYRRIDLPSMAHLHKGILSD